MCDCAYSIECRPIADGGASSADLPSYLHVQHSYTLEVPHALYYLHFAHPPSTNVQKFPSLHFPTLFLE
jgi:hypothetical protein